MCEEKSTWEQCLEVHGHVCVGLALGFRAVQAAMKELGVTKTDVKDLIVMAESRNCGVDVVPILAGCTIGQHNLIIKDYGKEAYRIGNKKTKEAVRALAKGEIVIFPPDHHELRCKVMTGQATMEERQEFQARNKAITQEIMKFADDEICKVERIDWCFQKKGAPDEIIPCEMCGENTASSYLVEQNGKRICMSCSEN